MGKRTRKTRWRALDIVDDHSDSEDSNTNSSAVSSRYSRQSTGYYSKYSYSSQSTPARRRYQSAYETSTKSTRSSSTTSETKITFNEDEYTRITTPRQDVLFKKGYLNKPKTYRTQTSTGNSTISTGTSTENGTPDHQSADLDYESQFVFPNGFVDQNGIYYVNSYEPYPLMLFNPPTYYQDFTNNKSKRYSTGSLSESISPNNEEATSQDFSQSGGEASNSGVSDYSGGPPQVFNMVYPGYYVNETCTLPEMANPASEPQVKKLKKRRERKSSKTVPGDSSDVTDDQSEEETAPVRRNNPSETPEIVVRLNPENAPKTADDHSNQKTDETIQTSSTLKADAEEFVPRAFQPLGPPPHIKVLPPNFVPIPLVPFDGFGAPHPAFIPPGIPLNFIPPPAMGQKTFPPQMAANIATIQVQIKDEQEDDRQQEREGTATPSHTPVAEEKPDQMQHNKTIDFATVMSKLEAVKLEQNTSHEIVKPPLNESKPFRNSPRFTNKRNYYNKYRNNTSQFRSGEQSPQESSPQHRISSRDSPARQPRVFTKPNGTSHQKKLWKPAQNKPYHNCSTTSNDNIQKQTDHKKVEVPKQNAANQWISVSSRKKKKNKNLEDVDFEEEDAVETSNDLFEAYDVEQLVDVVPPSQQIEKEEKRIENILTNIAQTEVPKLSSEPTEVVDVKEIEKELIIVEKANIVEAADEDKIQKKSKKGTQKPLMKKIIITDIFNDVPEDDDGKEEVKVITIKDEPKTIEAKSEANEVAEKKAKKKKKKSKQTVNEEDTSAPPTPIENEVFDKSNDEISLELDKLIQKGMYGSLQEKIKSINETESDDFFKILASTPTALPPSTSTSDLKSKSVDFNRIFQSTRQLLKPNMVSVEASSRDKVDTVPNVINEISHADAANQGHGFVLVEAEPQQQQISPATSEQLNDDADDEVNLYPITEAVREWIRKIEETTPNVEILKSPSSIRNDLIGSDLLNNTNDCDSDTEAQSCCDETNEEAAESDSVHHEKRQCSLQ